MSEGCKEVKNDASEVNNLVSKLVEQLDTERKEKSELERKVEKLTLECEEVAALRVQVGYQFFFLFSLNSLRESFA